MNLSALLGIVLVVAAVVGVPAAVWIGVRAARRWYVDRRADPKPAAARPRHFTLRWSLRIAGGLLACGGAVFLVPNLLSFAAGAGILAVPLVPVILRARRKADGRHPDAPNLFAALYALPWILAVALVLLLVLPGGLPALLGFLALVLLDTAVEGFIAWVPWRDLPSMSRRAAVNAASAARRAAVWLRRNVFRPKDPGVTWAEHLTAQIPFYAGWCMVLVCGLVDIFRSERPWLLLAKAPFLAILVTAWLFLGRKEDRP